jgi:hypothetical protein
MTVFFGHPPSITAGYQMREERLAFGPELLDGLGSAGDGLDPEPVAQLRDRLDEEIEAGAGVR